MRNPGFLEQLQTQLESLPLSLIKRVNRDGGLDLSSIFDLVLKPTDHTVDFYSAVDPETLLEGTSFETPDPVGVGLVLFVTSKTDLNRDDVRKALEEKNFPVWISCPRGRIEEIRDIYPDCRLLPQYEFVALTPDNLLFSTEENCLYTCGSGDAIASLVEDEAFIKFSSDPDNNIYLMDLDMSSCFIDQSLLAHHQEGSNVTASVVENYASDTCAVLCSVDGCSQLLERFLFMDSPQTFDYAHTGHIIFRANLKLDKIRWSWHRRKVIRDGTVQVHYKRYLYDFTEAYDTKFVKVSRELYTLK